jgi:glycosyltransferase involved in cell wall biosynthesis
MFPVRDVDALTAAIRRVGDDEDLRSRMSRASVDRARAQFDERQIVDRVMGAYADVARRKGRYESLVARWGDSGGSG